MQFPAMFSRVPVIVVLAVLAVLAGTGAAYNNGLGEYPPMGWNTWCTDDLCGLIDKVHRGVLFCEPLSRVQPSSLNSACAHFQPSCCNVE